MKRIGILGGTFDPPHIGHFLVADEVKFKMDLDEIWFIPTNEPPHKNKATLDSSYRLAMLQKATEQINYFKVNAVELERSGKSYTIDTIDLLKAQYPTYSFYFIIGADMVEYLPNWYKIDELIQKIQFVGVKRSNFKVDSPYPIHEVNIPTIDISSTNIKERIKIGAPVQYFLPKEVYAYIKEHHLYES